MGQAEKCGNKKCVCTCAPGQFTDSLTHSRIHSFICSHIQTLTYVSNKRQAQYTDPRARPSCCSRPCLRSGQTLIRSDNHGVPPKGMNCNFLFRGINCRACRSLGWLCSAGLQFFYYCYYCYPVLRTFGKKFSHSLSSDHCVRQALCIYVSYLFIYLFKILRFC